MFAVRAIARRSSKEGSDRIGSDTSHEVTMYHTDECKGATCIEETSLAMTA